MRKLNLDKMINDVQQRVAEAHGQQALRSFLLVAGDMRQAGPSLSDALDINDRNDLASAINTYSDLMDRWRLSQPVVDALCSIILVKCAIYTVPLPDFVLNSSAAALARQRFEQLVDGDPEEGDDSGGYTEFQARRVVHQERINRGDLPEGTVYGGEDEDDDLPTDEEEEASDGEDDE